MTTIAGHRIFRQWVRCECRVQSLDCIFQQFWATHLTELSPTSWRYDSLRISLGSHCGRITANSETIPILVKFLYIGSGWPTIHSERHHAIVGEPSKREIDFHWTRMIRTQSNSQSDTWMIWVVLLGIAIATIVKSCSYLWPDLLRWWTEKTSRNWPSISGVIDIVAVAKEVESGGKGPPIVTYMALLTYSYHNPDLQTGDYNRAFAYEDEAQDWTKSMKGRSVNVRVDPSDPARSVLRTEDVNAADPDWSGK